MGIIVCQTCEATIEHFDSEKVTTLYSRCPDCTGKKENNSKAYETR
ncbi:MAG TPA: GapA-binding peptide SR1P [Bacillales bacterium]|nr:GapA-binding peptide SR1P [Bacillales bacterium]